MSFRNVLDAKWAFRQKFFEDFKATWKAQGFEKAAGKLCVLWIEILF